MEKQKTTQTALRATNAMTRFPDAAPTPLIKHLSVEKQPHPPTSCDTCPEATFYQVRSGLVKCHCKLLNAITYETGDTNVITECDGREMALLREAEAEAAKNS